jgi:hypothetical protein
MTRVAGVLGNFVGLPLTLPCIEVLDSRKLGPSGPYAVPSVVPCVWMPSCCHTRWWCNQSGCSRWCSWRTFWVSEDPMPNLFSLLGGNRRCRALFTTVLVSLDVWWISDVDSKELEALNLLHYSPIDENGGVLGPPFSVVDNHLQFSSVLLKCDNLVLFPSLYLSTLETRYF